MKEKNVELLEEKEDAIVSEEDGNFNEQCEEILTIKHEKEELRLTKIDKTTNLYLTYTFLKYIKNYFMISYILLSFFETPHWCYQEKEKVKNY